MARGGGGSTDRTNMERHSFAQAACLTQLSRLLRALTARGDARALRAVCFEMCMEALDSAQGGGDDVGVGGGRSWLTGQHPLCAPLASPPVWIWLVF